MSATSETSATKRQILLVGPYGVLGTGVVDAVAENPKWRIITAARRPAPTYRAQAAAHHISVDLMDREGTTKDFSSLDKVTDLVFAAYVEKPTMAETVEPNARMLKHTLAALAARNVPLQRIVLAGGAKSYGFSLGAFNAPAKAIARGIGKPDLRYQQFPYDQMRQALTQAGFSPQKAAVYIEMFQAINASVLAAQEPRSPQNITATSFETFVQDVFAPAYQGKASAA